MVNKNTTLTSLFYKIFIEKLYMYILMKVIFKKNLFILYIFKLNNLKLIHNLYFQYLTQILSDYQQGTARSTTV
jgi:hypothetical protein